MSIADQLYGLLGDRESITCREAAAALNAPHDDVIAAMKSLEASLILKTSLNKITQPVLTSDGLSTLEKGSHEYRVATKINELVLASKGPVKKSVVTQHFTEGDFIAGYSGCMRSKWLTIISEGKKDPDPAYELSVPLESISDDTQTMLLGLVVPGTGNLDLEKIDDATLKQLKQKKLATIAEVKTFTITRGEKYSSGLEKQKPDLTIDAVRQYFLSSTAEADGSAVGKASADFNVKQLNFNALGTLPSLGAFHPLMEIRRLFVEIFVGMGFEQMETSKLVESSFWNFEVLFQPQSHPARDAQDTFFISGKYAQTRLDCLDKDLVERIQTAHVCGGESMRSRGYRYVWQLSEALRNIMRTHTTAVSARKLYEIGQHYQKTGEFRSRRFFSIDRVYRNETLDATHLCEFNQVEGMIIGRDLTLGNLIATLRAFFARLGLTQLRFKATYNPYTAPSAEIFAFHPQLRRWVEIGNSGMFRPEVLVPLGLPTDVQVLAWGLSLERPAMIIHALSNIRDLVGPTTRIDLVKNYHAFTL